MRRGGAIFCGRFRYFGFAREIRQLMPMTLAEMVMGRCASRALAPGITIEAVEAKPVMAANATRRAAKIIPSPDSYRNKRRTGEILGHRSECPKTPGASKRSENRICKTAGIPIAGKNLNSRYARARFTEEPINEQSITQSPCPLHRRRRGGNGDDFGSRPRGHWRWIDRERLRRGHVLQQLR